jgi:hypothetical protein
MGFYLIGVFLLQSSKLNAQASGQRQAIVGLVKAPALPQNRLQWQHSVPWAVNLVQVLDETVHHDFPEQNPNFNHHHSLTRPKQTRSVRVNPSVLKMIVLSRGSCSAVCGFHQTFQKPMIPGRWGR